jgi:RimJ/RimL family protein N-acetyltransferase
VLPEARERSEALGLEALGWLKEHTHTQCVIGFVRADNTAAQRYVERLGFEPKARLPNAALSGGHMDVVFYSRNL